MQSYDFLMLAVLIGCMVFGAWKGMAWQVASLASIGLSYIGAVNFAGVIAPMIKAEPPWNNAAAMLIVYVVSSIGVWMVFRLVSGFIDSVRLRDFDRQVGAVFGAAKGVLLCLVITFFAVSLSPQTAGGMVRSSLAGKYMTQLLKESDPYLPTRVHEVLDPYIKQFENQLNQQGTPNSPNGFPPLPGNPAQPQRPGLPGQPAQPPPRPFRNLISDGSSGPGQGGGMNTGDFRPNTSQAQNGGVLEFGSRILREFTGGSETTTNNPSATSGYGQQQGYAQQPNYAQPGYSAQQGQGYAQPQAYAQPQGGYGVPAAPPPNQRAAQPSSSSGDWFSRGLDFLQTVDDLRSNSGAPPRR